MLYVAMREHTQQHVT